MIVLVEEDRQEFLDFKCRFERLGEKLIRFSANDFSDFLKTGCRSASQSVEAVILNDVPGEMALLQTTVKQIDAPVLALVENKTIERTRSLYVSGIDDVIEKPIDAEELVLRIATIKRRMLSCQNGGGEQAISLFFDGRDPCVNGKPLALPRRERKILEFLALINGRRVTKSQIFEAVYGIYDEEFSESVVESHISRLRKKLRKLLSADPIHSIRYQGYALDPGCISITQ